MNIARINCAHDSRAEWQAMADNVRRAEAETGLTCKIITDLGGPKIRTQLTSFKKKHRFFKGDALLLTRGKIRKSDAYPLWVSCSLAPALDRIEVGHQVWFDDGLIGASVVQVVPEGAVLRIEHVSIEGERIRPEKGINLPDTDLQVAALTAKDLVDLDFVAENADMIGYSFVQTVADVRLLQEELRRRISDPARLDRLAIVAKIETRKAVQNLPDLIIAAAGVQPFGVMIARGDLAVEIGFERLAEIQEEMLWLCEAAHVPVIWATQVFENFVKTGVPTRSEVTDAAMSERAECVMLNKGDFVAEAVQLLDHVLVRMEGHQFKKRAELRALRSWPIPVGAED
jgi:pyruvate kinase